MIIAPIVVKPIDIAIALNSPTNVEITFMNVNTMADGTSLTVNAGSEVNLGCGANGNPDGYENGSGWKWTWSWEMTQFLYTELVGCTEPGGTCTLPNTQPINTAAG